MNKLEVVKFLIEEIEYEQTLPEIIIADEKQAKEKAKEYGTPNQYWKYEKYRGRQYSKSRITNNCKKIRQIMLDISKEYDYE